MANFSYPKRSKQTGKIVSYNFENSKTRSKQRKVDSADLNKIAHVCQLTNKRQDKNRL